MDNMSLYNKFRVVPENAKKLIEGGRLKGKTDINPMWRLKMLTEEFGPIGLGWSYTIKDQWLENGANGEIAAFCNIELFVKYEGEWSKPIPGTGGSMFIASEKNGLYTSDEAFKMALTDALSVACKAMGIGADVYFEKDKTKYTSAADVSQAPPKAAPSPVKQAPPTQSAAKAPEAAATELICSDCGVAITGKVADFSKDKYGRALCYKCQKGA